MPVFATSSTENIGTIPLLEALVAYTTAPTERSVRITRGEELDALPGPHSDEGPLVAYVFKTLNDRFVGTLNYFRIFSGAMSNDGRYHNAYSDENERFNSLFVMRGKEQMPVQTLHAGDIGVVAKLTNTKTGDTFVDNGSDVKIAPPDFPAPLYMVSVTPRSQADSAKMGPTLSNLCDADPTLRWRQDPDTRQTVLEGMGQIHLDVTLKRAESLGVNIDTDMPKVPYRETITGNGPNPVIRTRSRPVARDNMDALISKWNLQEKSSNSSLPFSGGRFRNSLCHRRKKAFAQCCPTALSPAIP